MVESMRQTENEVTAEKRYFVSLLLPNAKPWTIRSQPELAAAEPGKEGAVEEALKGMPGPGGSHARASGDGMRTCVFLPPRVVLIYCTVHEF